MSSEKFARWRKFGEGPPFSILWNGKCACPGLTEVFAGHTLAGMHQSQNVRNTSDEALCEIIAGREGSELAQRQARDACGELYLRHAKPLLAFLATRTTRSDLDDVHQAIWHRAWTSVGKSFTGGNFRAWLFQITRNYLIDESRKKRPDALADDYDDRDRHARRPDEILQDEERRDALARCLEKLEADAASLVQARLSGESYDEVCGRLQMKPERAHRLFHTAKQQLQRCVNQDES